MLLDSCSDGKYVYVKYDVFRAHSGLFSKKSVGSFAYLDLPVICCRLTLLVECHDNHCSSEFPYGLCLLYECFRTFLKTDGVHYALALSIL